MAGEVDRLFNDGNFAGSSGNLRLADLPYLARPIIEDIHETRPDVVIAGDRGGRLLAVTAFRSWKKRYPGERFPTADGSIRFARVTSRSAREHHVRKAIEFTLASAGFDPKAIKSREISPPTVMYLDDWCVHGETIGRFLAAADDLGIPGDNLTYATACGPRVSSVRHIVSDRRRHPRWSVWDSNQDYIGVYYGRQQPTMPIPYRNNESEHARDTINSYIEEYYRRFSAAVTGGQLVTSQCLDGRGGETEIAVSA